MRGLDIRADYALGKILAKFGFDPDSEKLCEALNLAQVMGYHDQNSDLSVPILFQDEPDLVEAWNDGNRIAWDHAVMANCWHCINGSGNPCPSHG